LFESAARRRSDVQLGLVSRNIFGKLWACFEAEIRNFETLYETSSTGLHGTNGKQAPAKTGCVGD
jgi:hypothetical protein